MGGKKGMQNPEVNRHCITLLWLPKQCLQELEITIPHLFSQDSYSAHRKAPKMCSVYSLLIHQLLSWPSRGCTGLLPGLLAKSLLGPAQGKAVFLGKRHFSSLFPVNICVLGCFFLQYWHSAKGYVQDHSCFPVAWREVQEDKPKHRNVLGVYNTGILPHLGWNEHTYVSLVQSLSNYTGILKK